MSLNKVILIGNLGRDPEVKNLDNQKVVATFSLATSESYNDKNGERRTETEWFNIEMWDAQARIAEKYLKKGSQVYIEGKLKTETWKDKEGVEKSRYKVRVQSFTLLGGNPNKNNDNSNGGNNSNNAAPQNNNYNAPEPQNDPGLSDDLPF
ncbi:MAG: single-stranded DNA-binding protein [Bacteroidota bacterium]